MKNYYGMRMSSHLQKKLASCTGSMNRIAASIPKKLYMNLYYTPFESYITYGITVWGSIPNQKLNKIFDAQKKIMRVLFGDREKLLDKFRTCIRAWPNYILFINFNH